MSVIAKLMTPHSTKGPSMNWLRAAQDAGAKCAARAARHDAGDEFVADNMAELKAQGFFKAAVPAELGGGDASYRELSEILRVLAHSCGSTALALSMHTHLVATAVWRWRRDPQTTEALLKRVANENIVLVSSGGSDWLNGSATAVAVEGGYRISGRKVFASGVPFGDVLMTTAVFDDPKAGPTVMHLPISLKAEGVKVFENWRTLGMRGTGSNDVELKDVFVAAGAVGARRPRGKWHPMMHTIVLVAFPLIYAVYVGLAEAARETALKLSEKRKGEIDCVAAVGELDTELAAARMALADMIAAAETMEPGSDATNRIMLGRTLVARAAIRAVELAMEAAGGAGFYRDAGLERIFRDVQAARFHPLREKPQALFAGRVALGLDVDG